MHHQKQPTRVPVAPGQANTWSHLLAKIEEGYDQSTSTSTQFKEEGDATETANLLYTAQRRGAALNTQTLTTSSVRTTVSCQNMGVYSLL